MTDTQPQILSPSESGPVPLAHQCAVYGIGTFSTTMYFMAVTIVPLWVRNMELSPFLLGIVLGCRPFLPLFLSIHAGALMDRLGTRRVMIFFAIIGVTAPLLYPALPWVGAVFTLQLLSGMADSMGWLGAQTLVGQVMKGRTSYAGRLSVIVRMGHVVGPPLVGYMWDHFGPWGAFGMISLWGFGVLGSALMIPHTAQHAGARETGGRTPREPVSWRDLIPRPSDYVSAFRLLAMPTVAITVLIGMMTHVGNNIQSSFYVVWLGREGFTATEIGSLFSLAAVAAAAGSLLAPRLLRHVPHYWLLWSVVLTALVLISITPLLGSYFLLAVVLSLRSASNGIHQPLVITLMLRSTGSQAHGRAIGLRGTMNRVTSIGGPVLMGAIAEVVGLETSFYMIGGIAAVFMLGLAWQIRRHPEIHERVRES